jgi:hypothetical protein
MKPQTIPVCPIIFEGNKYFGIKEFDCKCVWLFTEETLKGTFFTVIPTSNKEYRKNNPTESKVEIETKNDWTIFKIYSDWGQCYEMKIHNSLKTEIDFAKQEAINKCLL